MGFFKFIIFKLWIVNQYLVQPDLYTSVLTAYLVWYLCKYLNMVSRQPYPIWSHFWPSYQGNYRSIIFRKYFVYHRNKEFEKKSTLITCSLDQASNPESTNLNVFHEIWILFWSLHRYFFNNSNRQKNEASVNINV